MAARLANSTSPYLRQHRDNPVDWYEWGDQAFTDAARRDVPVLLSVGYSACHWCHVMAHESFEDPTVAEVMNANFVCIKVDREERPDVDAVYMDAVQAMTGRGGWPMTVFLTPTGEPFYGGTYFPKPGFLNLLAAITEVWRDRRNDVESNADSLMEVLRRSGAVPDALEDTHDDDDEILALATSRLAEQFDEEWGGFGSAPKFPSTFALEHLMRQWTNSGDPRLRSIVTTSLDAMVAGGIHDHIGGGFARYSVDEKWLVPHFEKMLYDQALLARCFLHAWQLWGEDRHRRALDDTIDYVLDRLTAPEGGFYCAEDADSLDVDGHSHEGLFYTWTPDEVRAVLGADAGQACAWWGIDDDGNFEGRSIPNRLDARADTVPTGDLAAHRLALRSARESRPRPLLDDKVLTEWSAMMTATLAEAAGATGRSDWASAATAAGRFLHREMQRADGRWLRTWHRESNPHARHPATAHDLAHLIDAFTRVYELEGDPTWLDRAVAAATDLLEHHRDDRDGALFTVADDAEQLVVRAVDYLDTATASANSVAAFALLRLAALTGRDDLEAAARSICDRLAAVSARAPTATCHLHAARHLFVNGIAEIVISGNRPDLLATVRARWTPNGVCAHGRPFASPLWDGRSEGRAYVCRRYECLAPVDSVAALEEALNRIRPS